MRGWAGGTDGLAKVPEGAGVQRAAGVRRQSSGTDDDDEHASERDKDGPALLAVPPAGARVAACRSGRGGVGRSQGGSANALQGPFVARGQRGCGGSEDEGARTVHVLDRQLGVAEQLRVRALVVAGGGFVRLEGGGLDGGARGRRSRRGRGEAGEGGGSGSASVLLSAGRQAYCSGAPPLQTAVARFTQAGQANEPGRGQGRADGRVRLWLVDAVADRLDGLVVKDGAASEQRACGCGPAHERQQALHGEGGELLGEKRVCRQGDSERDGLTVGRRSAGRSRGTCAGASPPRCIPAVPPCGRSTRRASPL